MVVKWDDGEMTLYHGTTDTNLKDIFTAETQLAKPGSIWKHAKRIAPSNSGGLYVLWDDGELTVYDVVDAKGFTHEYQISKPNDLWRDHASHIASIRDHLVVVWNDGEVSLYEKPRINKLSKERQLVKPNATWKNVQGLTSGDFTGRGVFAEDLLVRWVDGEVSVYSDVATNGLGAEKQVLKPNDLWTHATVVSGRGSLNTGLIVRWVDGEVTHYPFVAVDGSGAGYEYQLVAP